MVSWYGKPYNLEALRGNATESVSADVGRLRVAYWTICAKDQMIRVVDQCEAAKAIFQLARVYTSCPNPGTARIEKPGPMTTLTV